MSLGLTAAVVIGMLYIYMMVQLPSVSTLNDMHLQVPLRVYSKEGKLIAQFGSTRRIPVTLDQIPPLLIKAVLATEDARFYEHSGIDLKSMVRATVAVIASGKKVQGASTITMQVARNFFLTKKKTYARKINEILLAIKIDQEFSKDKILELYLNKIYFGNRAYGVAAAAQVYYGKTLNQLTLPEMAVIAGLPQAPSRNNPLINPKAALKRRNHVLERMYEVGYIDKKTYEKAIRAPLNAKYHAEKVEVYAPYVAEMVRQSMVDQYGDDAYDRGLEVYTTVSENIQSAANRALIDGLITYDHRHGFRKPTQNLKNDDPSTWGATLKNLPVIDILQPAAVTQINDQSIDVLLSNGETALIPWSGLSWARREIGEGYVGVKPTTASQIVTLGDIVYVTNNNGHWMLSQIPQAQGAIVILNPNNGAVLGLSGGFNYELSPFNRAVQALRQPGSGFKPFIYSAALEKGYTLATVINDAPIVTEDSGENELWRPMNDTKKFYGPTSLRIALIKSRNLVSIRLLQQIGIPYAIDYIKRFGFDTNALPDSLSLALGTGSVTPLEIATGYAVFANGGYHVQPYFIDKIEDETHQILFTATPAQACMACITNPDLPINEMPNPVATQAITPQNAYLMTNALQGVIKSGTGSEARLLGRKDLAGKTGTTNDEADGWFSGFNSHLLATVWVGFDNLHSLREHGAQSALPIWMEFMKIALKDTPETTMPEPANIISVRINPKTGLLANPNDPNASFELFEAKYVPKKSDTNTDDHLASDNQSGDNSDQSLF